MAAPDICPCGTGAAYSSCCGKFHAGEALPATALELMRSRYSAFAAQEISYLRETLWPPYQKKFDALAHESRSRGSTWLGLEIIEAKDGGEQDRVGMVHFIAASMIGNNLERQEERSLFRKKGGRWYYTRPE